jgi:hypothetical protein
MAIKQWKFGFSGWLALAGLNGLLWPATPALAWGPDGHHTVAALAAQLIAGRPAEAQVRQLLGGISLQDAAVWADCARGIDPAKGYTYTNPGQYAECQVFETPQGEAEMADFVRRNDTNCNRKANSETCHKQYHYTDVALQRKVYQLGKTGTRDDDIVAALQAVIKVLQGQPAPAPFQIKDQREALLLLAHYVADVHQPLHVGAIYLDATGKQIDPDTGKFVASMNTYGGNDLITLSSAGKPSSNLHHVWDEVPAALKAGKIDAAWLARARKVTKTKGTLNDWPVSWANGTLTQAKAGYAGLSYDAKIGSTWATHLPANYTAQINTIKDTQITRAGARLAQVLQTIWP